MAFRIGDSVVRGELNNTRPNSVCGWLDVGGDAGIRIELTGDLDGELAGKHLRFETSRLDTQAEQPPAEYLDALELRQIGVVGSMLLRMVRVPRGPVKESYLRAKLGEPAPVDEKPCLYLEWFSQNGRVVAEIVDPVLAYGHEAAENDVTPEALPDAADAGGPEIVGFAMNENGEIEELPFTDNDGLDEDDDPYQLFPPDLEGQLHDSNHDTERATDGNDESPALRDWDEVIPGIDEETKQLYEKWDEVVHGGKNEPLATLFDPPLALKRPDQIIDETEARESLKVVLARLALHWVAVDMCEHFTARDAYRWLLEEILPDAQIHPQLPSTGFVQHYSTWEDCPQCEAEFEADWEERHGDDSSDPSAS